MFFVVPTRVEDGSRSNIVPVANALLVAANVILYFLGFYCPVGPRSGPLSVIGYSFSHAGAAHLIVNMWVLLMFGNAVNRRLGNGYYATCYLGTAVALGLFAKTFAGSYLVGSSGAVFAVIGVMSLLMPSAVAQVAYVAVLPFTILLALFSRPTHWLYWVIRWDTIRISAWWCLLLIPAMQLMGLMWRPLNWTNLAHLGGFLAGIVFVLLLPERISMQRRPSYQF